MRDKSIFATALRPRVVNALIYIWPRILTIKMAAMVTERELVSIPGIGRKSLIHTKRVLAGYGLRLAQTDRARRYFESYPNSYLEKISEATHLVPQIKIWNGKTFDLISLDTAKKEEAYIQMVLNECNSWMRDAQGKTD